MNAMKIGLQSPQSLLPSQEGGSTTKNENSMDMDMFLYLLTVQLSTQNPLEPMSDRDFFAQMAQLGTVQGIDALKESMAGSQANGLLGQKVTALRPYTESESGLNEVVTGTVKRVTLRDGTYYLGIQEADGGITEVSLANVRQVETSSE